MKKIIFVFVSLFSFNAFSTPQRIEMIFMSPEKITSLMEYLDRKETEKLFKLTAQNNPENECIPMGDGCFHPQFGYMDKKADDVNNKNIKVPSLISEEFKLKTFNAIETNLVNCDKDYYFDIYCGKAKASAGNAEVEIWFDVSSSLRATDYNKDPNYCNRRTFATKVMESCKDKVRISIYNTMIKEVGELSSTCLSYGTNDERKLLQWLQDSNARVLLIVTDIDELSSPMRNFLESHGAKFTGDGSKAFTSTDLAKYASEFAKSCRK